MKFCLKSIRLLGTCALLSLLTACINPQVGVRGSSQNRGIQVSSRAPEFGTHLVSKGDTLYSIAFKYSLDFRELAAWNQIAEPFVIHPNQRLSLNDPARPPLEASARPPLETTRPQLQTIEEPQIVQSSAQSAAQNPIPPERSPPISVENGVAVSAIPEQAPLATPQALSPTNQDGLPTGFSEAAETDPALTQPGAVPAAASPTQSGAVTATSPSLQAPELAPIRPTLPAIVQPISEKPVQVANIAPPAGKGGWGWPAGGRLISTFSGADASRQGIDIAGNLGDPVRAAKSGEVVYSGRGIIGYGELIVIKHDDATLTAYGHNRKRNVKEGQKVAQGQAIAEVGRDPQGRNLLHFEVRRNGKPVDPLGVLPKR